MVLGRSVPLRWLVSAFGWAATESVPECCDWLNLADAGPVPEVVFGPMEAWESRWVWGVGEEVQLVVVAVVPVVPTQRCREGLVLRRRAAVVPPRPLDVLCLDAHRLVWLGMQGSRRDGSFRSLGSGG